MPDSENFLSKVRQRVDSAPDAEPTPTFAGDHADHAQRLADEHAESLDILRKEPHDRTYASHLSRQFMSRAERDMMALIELTHDPEALRILSQVEAETALHAKHKLEGKPPPDLPMSENYDEDMEAKKARARKAFGNLIKLHPDDQDKDEMKDSSSSQSEINAKKKARFASLLKKKD